MAGDDPGANERARRLRLQQPVLSPRPQLDCYHNNPFSAIQLCSVLLFHPLDCHAMCPIKL